VLFALMRFAEVEEVSLLLLLLLLSVVLVLNLLQWHCL